MAQHEDPLWSFKDDRCRLEAFRTVQRHQTGRMFLKPVLAVICACTIGVLPVVFPGTGAVAERVFMKAMSKILH